jgi:hypothetical protein
VRALVEQIVDGLRFVHKHKGYLQVDGNELNYMVTDKYNDLYFIDVNSFKTPSFPADAIMPSIRDWNAGTNFTELTDWYSFAIISFYMFTGIHPFKGRHPRFPDLKTAMVEQMKAGVSVLDKDTQFPKAAVYFPFDTVIPANYLPWYRAIFVDGKRLPPPGVLSTGAAATIILKPQEITGTGNFDINELRRFMGQITGYLECNGREIVVTTDGIYVDNQPYNKINGRFRCGFTDKSFTPVALVIDGDKAMIWNIVGQNWLTDGKAPWFAFADDIMSYNGRLYIHYGQHIFEIGFIENAGPGIMVVQHPVATVMPKASRMYQGVVFQDVFGARLASIFPKSREHRQIKIAELAGGANHRGQVRGQRTHGVRPRRRRPDEPLCLPLLHRLDELRRAPHRERRPDQPQLHGAGERHLCVDYRRGEGRNLLQQEGHARHQGDYRPSHQEQLPPVPHRVTGPICPQ